ncbi:subtilisin-like serine protease [Tulasnella sp. 403]|nr:subtilisin-like serine protease [Tulasnella sp. 403]
MIQHIILSLISTFYLRCVYAAVPHWKIPGAQEHIVKLGDATDKATYLAALKQRFQLPSEAILFDYDPNFINAFAVRIDSGSRDALDQILSDVTNVQYVIDDASLQPDGLTYTQKDAPAFLARMSSRDSFLHSSTYIYPGTAGEGVDVYVVDSGVNIGHTEFRTWSRVSRAKCGFSVTSDKNCDDLNGHGTSVASLAAGNSFGIAKNANIIAIKIRGDDNLATLAREVAGMAYIYATAPSTRRPSIVTYSMRTVFGDGSNEPPLLLDVLTGIGIHFINSAGNSGKRLADAYCGELPFITVGALDTDDAQAGFSNYGPCVKFWARGEGIKTAWISNSNDVKDNLSGTSFATPLVAGVAALILGKSDSLQLTPPGSPPNAKRNIAEKGTMPPRTLITELQKGAYAMDGYWKNEPITYMIPQAPRM